MNFPYTIQKTPDYQLTVQESDAGWQCKLQLRGREFVSSIGRCSRESAERQALILARQRVRIMFEGLL